MMSQKQFNPLLLLFLILTIASSACKTFKDRNNENFKMWGLSKDGYKTYKGKDSIYFEPFNLNNYTSGAKSAKPQIVTASDIAKLKELNKNFTLVLWLPFCGASEKNIRFTKHLDSIKTPYLLASTTYDLLNINRRFQQAGLTDKNIYIVPSADIYDGRHSIKHGQFLKHVCPECAETYKDEMMFANALIFRQGKPTEVIFDLSEVKITNE